MSNKTRESSAVTRHSNRNATVDRRLKKAASTAAQSIVERELAARGTGPDVKKHWSIGDMIRVAPLTETQSVFARAYCEGQNLMVYGSAGTGKTFLACAMAIGDVLHDTRPQTRVIIIRSTVAARDPGHLPGTLDEKISPYEDPYRDIFRTLFKRARTYDDMKDAGLIEFMSTSHIRGLTWDNAIIIADEVQNMNWEEINTIATRAGKNSRVILCGDTKQNDLYRNQRDVSGMEMAIKVTGKMSRFSHIVFTREDIVRDEFVREWIIACEETFTK